MHNARMMKLLTELKFELLQIARALLQSIIYSYQWKIKDNFIKIWIPEVWSQLDEQSMCNIHHKSIINMEYICISGLKK